MRVHLGLVLGLTVDIKARRLTEWRRESLDLSGDAWEPVPSLGPHPHHMARVVHGPAEEFSLEPRKPEGC